MVHAGCLRCCECFPRPPSVCSQVGVPGFSPMAFLSSEAQLLTWQDQGLPADTLSAQNALAILHGLHTPFIIDPSSQVWL